MSALGKLDYHGDFDEQGQLVETPYRPQLAKKAAPAKPQAQPQAKVTQDLARPAPLPPNPAPLNRRPAPADLALDRSRDILLSAFGKATLSDRYLMPGESFRTCSRAFPAPMPDLMCRPCPAALRRHEPALVHARHAHSFQWRHQARASHFLLSQ